ncbi:MAG: hypothetical protein A3E01_07075 [Gammaproteobacteria bacterium RIFCSPHIGHO2_12_FULL_63_22]|nr:MAG: hypothetical protein A3E01_07075 [Gammaproteobacteria bacterium RIFCSPHIGHO2_12_FULL_63_22]
MLLLLNINLGLGYGVDLGGTPADGFDIYNDGAAMRVQTLSDVTGLREWIDYIPVYVVTDTPGKQWRVDPDGFIPIVEE